MSSSDDDAPTALSTERARALETKRRKDMASFAAAERARTRASRLQRQQAAAALQENGMEDGAADVTEDDAVLERMERAMREAGEESDLVDEDDADTEEDEDEDEDADATAGDEGNHGLDDAMELGSDDDEDDEGEDDAPVAGQSTYSAPRLPDHLFAAALPAPAPVAAKKLAKASAKRKAKKAHRRASDLVVGARTVRVVPPTSTAAAAQQASAAGTLPQRQVSRFLKRTLALSTQSKTDGTGAGARPRGRARDWERRPANLGVMKVPGRPAARFVRGA